MIREGFSVSCLHSKCLMTTCKLFAFTTVRPGVAALYHVRSEPWIWNGDDLLFATSFRAGKLHCNRSKSWWRWWFSVFFLRQPMSWWKRGVINSIRRRFRFRVLKLSIAAVFLLSWASNLGLKKPHCSFLADNLKHLREISDGIHSIRHRDLERLREVRPSVSFVTALIRFRELLLILGCERCTAFWAKCVWAVVSLWLLWN